MFFYSIIFPDILVSYIETCQVPSIYQYNSFGYSKFLFKFDLRPTFNSIWETFPTLLAKKRKNAQPEWDKVFFSTYDRYCNIIPALWDHRLHSPWTLFEEQLTGTSSFHHEKRKDARSLSTYAPGSQARIRHCLSWNLPCVGVDSLPSRWSKIFPTHLLSCGLSYVYLARGRHSGASR